MLYSTGCRVSELERLNISDVNFETKEVILFGKGNKHRTSYLNAKAEIALKNYLDSRDDDNDALFVNKVKPHNRLKKGTSEIGNSWNSGLLSGDNVHPTEMDAKVLANQLLIDFNEIIN